jgi:hypothetical protein
MKRLLEKVHDGITTFNYNGNSIPCVVFGERKFDEIMRTVAGKPISIDTNLNILQDGLGHVFVEITLTFSDGGINEKILLNANESVDFFELLAKTSMLAISAPHSEVGKENVFMIQLPRPEKAVNALDIIKRGLESSGTSPK